MSNSSFKKTLIIGLGLIGGSFAKALKKHDLSTKIFAFDSDLEAIDLAKSDGIIDGGSDNLQLLDDDFDFVAIATPLSTYEEIFAEIENCINPTTILIDLGSLKNFIHEILPKNLTKKFIACHPIAGSEETGFENSNAELFKEKKFLICPSKYNNSDDLKKIENLVRKMGCNIDHLDAKKHDEIYALVSHLPQFLSFLTKEFSPKDLDDNFLKTAFRLDNSSPEIWSDIFELNDENLEKYYLEFFANLEKNITILTKENATDQIKNWIKANGDTSEKIIIDPQLLEQNFASIFFRTITVVSYLQISQINSLKTYAGSGFRDFTSIVKILDFDNEKLLDLIAKNQKKLLKIFNSIS